MSMIGPRKRPEGVYQSGSPGKVKKTENKAKRSSIKKTLHTDKMKKHFQSVAKNIKKNFAETYNKSALKATGTCKLHLFSPEKAQQFISNLKPEEITKIFNQMDDKDLSKLVEKCENYNDNHAINSLKSLAEDEQNKRGEKLSNKEPVKEPIEVDEQEKKPEIPKGKKRTPKEFFSEELEDPLKQQGEPVVREEAAVDEITIPNNIPDLKENLNQEKLKMEEFKEKLTKYNTSIKKIYSQKTSEENKTKINNSTNRLKNHFTEMMIKIDKYEDRLLPKEVKDLKVEIKNIEDEITDIFMDIDDLLRND